MSVSSGDIFLICFACFVFGLCNYIGYYFIYLGSAPFCLRKKLSRTGRDGVAKIDNKWTNTLQLDAQKKTYRLLTYAFSYENKEYKINHMVPNATDCTTKYDKLQMNDNIAVLFNPANPDVSLPKMAYDYPKFKSIKQIVTGILVVIFSVSAACGIIYLFDNDILGSVVYIANLCAVLFIYPILVAVCIRPLCKKKAANYSGIFSKSEKKEPENKPRNEKRISEMMELQMDTQTAGATKTGGATQTEYSTPGPPARNNNKEGNKKNEESISSKQSSKQSSKESSKNSSDDDIERNQNETPGIDAPGIDAPGIDARVANENEENEEAEESDNDWEFRV